MDLGEAVWRKAPRSHEDGDQCVEVASLSDLVAVRASKDPSGPVLLLTRAALRAAVESAAEI